MSLEILLSIEKSLISGPFSIAMFDYRMIFILSEGWDVNGTFAGYKKWTQNQLGCLFLMTVQQTQPTTCNMNQIRRVGSLEASEMSSLS